MYTPPMPTHKNLFKSHSLCFMHLVMELHYLILNKALRQDAVFKFFLTLSSFENCNTLSVFLPLCRWHCLWLSLWYFCGCFVLETRWRAQSWSGAIASHWTQLSLSSLLQHTGKGYAHTPRPEQPPKSCFFTLSRTGVHVCCFVCFREREGSSEI